MLTVQTAPPLSVTDEQRSVLEVTSRSTSAPHRAVLQAKALLLCADGISNYEVARRVGVSVQSVRAWRARFSSEGTEFVGTIAKGRGRRSWLAEGTVAEIVRMTMFESPDDTSTHWSTRTLADRLGVGKDTVARVWRDHELKPWKTERFKISNDPHFEEKLVDVVGLYMDRPERAIVFSFDEKTQVQALDRTQPSLPMKRGRGGTMTHDYKRNGTTDLFAAMNVATGEVLYDCKKGHKATDVLGFFKLIDLHVPKDLEIHVVLDTLPAHRAPPIPDWLADPKRARWHLHFTPTSSSWCNLVERWFGEITERRIRRGVFTSVPNLIEAIELWAEHWNDDPKPFVWHKPAQEIIEKVRRGRAKLAQVKSATAH